MAATYTLAVGFVLLLVFATVAGNRVIARAPYNCSQGVCLLDPFPSKPSPTPKPLRFATQTAVSSRDGLLDLLKPTSYPTPTPHQVPDYDVWVDKYARKYFGNQGERRVKYAKYLLNCLLWRESATGESKAHGDSGKAGGWLQFWNGTWAGFRKEMIRAGLIKEVGSRYDPESAIETTAWALSDKRGYNWGPIARRECW